MEILNKILEILPFLTGLIVVATGYLTRIYPPKGINKIYGYRTKASMASIERWGFAQDYSSSKSIQLGCLVMIISLIIYLFSPLGYDVNLIISICLLIVSLFYLIYIVEQAIRKRFGSL